MTTEEAVTMLLERLGLSPAAVGEAKGVECRAMLTEALAMDEQLPTSWYEVWERVEAVENRRKTEPSAPIYDFWLIYGPLNRALSTMSVTFPREFW